MSLISKYNSHCYRIYELNGLKFSNVIIEYSSNSIAVFGLFIIVNQTDSLRQKHKYTKILATTYLQNK